VIACSTQVDGFEEDIRAFIGEPDVNACESDAACSDGDPCNGVELCREEGCAPGAPPSCRDDDPCTLDLCEAGVGCVHPPVEDGTPCPDGDACNGAETCQAGTCKSGTPLVCDDGDACTQDACQADRGCIHNPIACGAKTEPVSGPIIGSGCATMPGPGVAWPLLAGILLFRPRRARAAS
jgi:hypothetical protein